MDAVSDGSSVPDISEADELNAMVEGARAEMERAIQLSGLKNDPLVPLMRAVVSSLLVQHQLHRANAAHLHDVSDQLDRQVSQSLAAADRELAAREAAVLETLVPQLVAATDQAVKARLWTVKLRTVAVSAAGAMILLLVALVGGYGMGFRSGQATEFRTQNAITAAAAQDGPAAAALWRQIIANNDPRAAMARCRKAITQQDGRRACPLPIWLDPSMPPAGP